MFVIGVRKFVIEEQILGIEGISLGIENGFAIAQLQLGIGESLFVIEVRKFVIEEQILVIEVVGFVIANRFAIAQL